MVLRLSLALAAAAVACPAQLVREWHRVSTPHFELISRYDPARTSPLLADLEWTHAVFAANFGTRLRWDRRVLVLIPDDPYEFEKMSPSPWAQGFYAELPYRDIVVLRGLLQARRALLHEYTHLLLRRSGGRYPRWFEEGTAEYFATLRSGGSEPVAGDPLQNSLALLRKAGWLPLAYFLQENALSAFKDHSSASRFYAQSWLYVHMMRLSPTYRGRFAEFQALLAEGVSTEQALARVYGNRLEDWEADARSWLRRPAFPAERLKPPSEPPAPRPEVQPVGDLDVAIARSTLLAARMPVPDIRAEYERLSRLAGERCEREASLGDLAYAARLWRQAAAHYQVALQCGVRKEDLSEGLQFALSRQPAAATTELGSFTVETTGAFANFMLGTGRFFEGDFAGALEAFAAANGLAGDDLFRMTRLKALAHARLNQFAEAAEAAAKLEPLARSPDQKITAQLTTEDVDRARRAAEIPQEPYSRTLLRRLNRLDGVVTRVDCLGTSARFWVEAGGRTFKLLVADPSEVTSGGEGKPLEFACGPQRKKLIVGYQEQADAATDTIGRIRYLEFR